MASVAPVASFTKSASAEMGPTRLVTLEVGRFLAAAMVALFHYSGAFEDLRSVLLLGGALRVGSIGVTYFFVLSGFVIYHIHATDIGAPGRLRSFLWKRAIRIYPFFWGACLAMVCASHIFDIRDTSFLRSSQVIADILLLPFDGEQILEVAWTLRQEVVFYAIFALLIAYPRLGWLLLFSWLILSCVSFLLVPDIESNGLLKPFAFTFNIGFGIGMLAAWAYNHGPTRTPVLWIAAGGGLLAALCLRLFLMIRDLPPHTPTATGNSLDPILFSIGFGLLVYGLVCWERLRPLRGTPFLMLLGGSSYLLYLTHGFVGSVVIRVFNFGSLRPLPNAGVLVAMFAAAVTAACLAHIWFERPLLRIMRKGLRFRPAMAQTE